MGGAGEGPEPGRPRRLLAPDALLFYWPYARFGYNFHPPAGRAARPADPRRLRRLDEGHPGASLGVGLRVRRRPSPWLFGFLGAAVRPLGRRGGGGVAAADAPGLWRRPHRRDRYAGALALGWWLVGFWKGLHEPRARRWRVVVGVAVGLGFVEKMAAVAVLGPILLWLAVDPAAPDVRRPRGAGRPGSTAGVTSTALLVPIGLAFARGPPPGPVVPAPGRDRRVRAPARPRPCPGRSCSARCWSGAPPPGRADLARRARSGASSGPAWRPGHGVLAFAPVVGWLGNPGWWRETLPRMAHYYALNADRRGALPDIRILYLGEIYTTASPGTTPGS